jgi:hypothetical protein
MKSRTQPAERERFVANARITRSRFHDLRTYQGDVAALISLPRVHLVLHIGPLKEAR